MPFLGHVTTKSTELGHLFKLGASKSNNYHCYDELRGWCGYILHNYHVILTLAVSTKYTGRFQLFTAGPIRLLTSF